ncbi:MAG: transglutaminase domain-containing protein [Clostridia bacterium]|nr:transglutaminase domain-containing protein [Clostridia bacterium]
MKKNTYNLLKFIALFLTVFLCIQLFFVNGFSFVIYGKQQVFSGFSNDINDYTYMSRAEAQALIDDYYNYNAYFGQELIYYLGDPIEGFDHRVHGTYNTYKTYKEATRQCLVDSQRINDTYSASVLLSVVVETWDESMSESQYNTAMSTLRSISSQFNYGSDYDKIMNVAEYVASNISYDYSKTYGDIYHGIVEETGVCAAYAECFQICMENLGIESYIYTDSAHALNVVALDGEYYFVDPTNMSDPNGVRWQFFLYGTNMRDNHTNLPISDTSYDGYTGNYGISNIETAERIETSEIQVENDVTPSEPEPIPTEPQITAEEVTEETTTEAETESTSTSEIITSGAEISSESIATVSGQISDSKNNSYEHNVKNDKDSRIIVILVTVLVISSILVIIVSKVYYKKKNS